MLGSISPVGEATRNQRWWLTATAYVLASAVAGALVGGALGVAGTPLAALAPASARLAVLGLALLVAAAVDAGVFGDRLPSWRRQVDERWLDTYRGWVYGAGFGAQLGAAVATIVTSAVTYAALLAALLTGSWWTGAVVGGTFGVARALPLLLLAPVRAPAGLWAVTRRVAEAEPLARRVTIAAQGLIGLVVLGLVAAT